MPTPCRTSLPPHPPNNHILIFQGSEFIKSLRTNDRPLPASSPRMGLPHIQPRNFWPMERAWRRRKGRRRPWSDPVQEIRASVHTVVGQFEHCAWGWPFVIQALNSPRLLSNAHLWSISCSSSLKGCYSGTFVHTLYLSKILKSKFMKSVTFQCKVKSSAETY